MGSPLTEGRNSPTARRQKLTRRNDAEASTYFANFARDSRARIFCLMYVEDRANQSWLGSLLPEVVPSSERLVIFELVFHAKIP